jgi:hypothetical protein
LALEILILLQKPKFVFIDEPWMNFEAFTLTWLNILGLKIFCINGRENIFPQTNMMLHGASLVILMSFST